jgi:hypothetical protein
VSRRIVLVFGALALLALLPSAASAAKPQFLTVPPAITNSTIQTFEFHISDPISYACRIDGGATYACGSPSSVAGLYDGPHTFEVQALYTAHTETCTPNGSGGFDCVPDPPVVTLSEFAAHSFGIDRTKPVVTFSGGTANKSSSTKKSVKFNFSSEPGSEFKCSLDGTTPEPCVSPLELGHRAPGAHKLTIQATDAAGNVGDLAARLFGINTSRKTIKFISQTKYKSCTKSRGKQRCKKHSV